MSVAVYIYNPQIAYKGLKSVVFIVSSQTDGRSDTEYGVHPYLDHKLKLVLKEARERNINLQVIEGYRPLEKQQRYYDQGRITKGAIITNAPPGLSYHNHGWAVDVCEFRSGKPYWKSKHWKEIGDIAKKHGLVWGGDWKRLVDKPHLQLSINDILIHALF